MHPIVILGTGLAGYSAAREWRKLDRASALLLVTADDGAFYTKPQLSNAYAQGKTPEQLVNHSAEEMAGQLNARILPHTRVEAVDPAARTITAAGAPLPYSRLVLALGADPIRLPLAGNAASEVYSVNDLADYARFRAAAVGARQVLILGAGLIGCEFANDLLTAGYAVEVVDLAPQPLGRLLPPRAAAHLQRALAAAGVRWHLGRSLEAIERRDRRLHARFADGQTVETDLVLSAVGLKPRTALAQAAGLKINRGIVTDRFLQTSATDIYALGDCAEVEGWVLPFVMPIMQAAKALARSLHGTPAAVHYPAMPVLVKTPACPTAVCPPPPGADGHWEETEDHNGVRALYYDMDRKLRGFALTGAAAGIKQRLALAKEIPDWLGP
jgi:rubredoxin-NAD+ reductase